MARYTATAKKILNAVAVEAGLDAAASPVGSTEKHFVQLLNLLNIALEELAEVYAWETLNRAHTLTTDNTTYPDGEYPLPGDFHYMIPQTQWDLTNDLPLVGPLSAQMWAYLEGRDLASTTIYASFRQKEGVFALYPTPPSNGLQLSFEYQSTNWIRNAGDTDYLTEVVDDADTILLPPTLVRSYLKQKYLSSKGFSTIDASEAVSVFLSTTQGHDKGAPVLSLHRRNRYPYLNAQDNVRDTGYGSSS